ncbi:MAG: regulatory protein RecX [Oscillospiraceae bacterium]
MKIEKIEASKHITGRFLLYLEGGDPPLKVTEAEMLTFDLHRGRDLDEATLAELSEAGTLSGAKGRAAALIGSRPLSKQALIRRLTDKGETAEHAAAAADWLEEIGAVNDADYAALLVRHYGEMGYGARRLREKFYEKGVPKELWDDALLELTDPAEQIDRFLASKLRGRIPDEKERKRLSDALSRRGYDWGDIRAALRRVAETELTD